MFSLLTEMNKVLFKHVNYIQPCCKGGGKGRGERIEIKKCVPTVLALL